jgi:hypothetical protein
MLEAQRVDVVVMEVSVYSLNRLGTTVKSLVDRLRQSGYQFYRLSVPGVLRRWTYRREPTIPPRRPGKHSLLTTVLIGLQDLERHFNLVAIRGSHPAVAGRPRYFRAGRLRLTDG